MALHIALQFIGLAEIAGCKRLAYGSYRSRRARRIDGSVGLTGPEGDVVERDALLVGATVDYRTLSAVAQHKRFFKKLSRSVEANPEIGIDRC